ncbi:alanine aminotransferase [Perkinsela sp. CCAP 1560/4]|nr:alanine aminotransferase [Perkinsela sp. CCAP 1560/4]|eukprot:KNH03775.1 alanine aminotransferase [Perkinsela sp. CCAP 1560/4]
MQVNPRVVSAQYAVRGIIPTRAYEIEEEIKSGSTKYPFDKLIFCNIGNPQALAQKPLTYPRQVMALVDCPSMLTEGEKLTPLFQPDVIARAQGYIESGWSGAYTHSLGSALVRNSVCQYIAQRDGLDVKSVANTNIILTDGASNAAKLILQTIIGSENDAVMIPIPQYPLYSACLTLLGGTAVHYYLNEQEGWSLDVNSMKAAYDACVECGKVPKAIVVINPGNPTGQVLEASVLHNLIRFAHDRQLLIIADEVYQENIYCKDEGKHFISIHKAAMDLGGSYASQTMIASLHSTSKGILGECGRRGGYLHLANIPAEFYAQLLKLASISLCGNVNGQLLMDLMVKTPQAGDKSYASYCKEYEDIFVSLKRRAKRLVEGLNAIPGIHSQPIEGAMYAFPQLQISEKYIAYNQEKNQVDGTDHRPDTRWCLELLESTGIVVVPGSGFGQVQGTYHFRITILPPEDDMDYMIQRIGNFQRSILEVYP